MRAYLFLPQVMRDAELVFIGDQLLTDVIMVNRAAQRFGGRCLQDPASDDEIICNLADAQISQWLMVDPFTTALAVDQHPTRRHRHPLRPTRHPRDAAARAHHAAGGLGSNRDDAEARPRPHPWPVWRTDHRAR